jgi:hypothetical protein
MAAWRAPGYSVASRARSLGAAFGQQGRNQSSLGQRLRDFFKIWPCLANSQKQPSFRRRLSTRLRSIAPASDPGGGVHPIAYDVPAIHTDGIGAGLLRGGPCKSGAPWLVGGVPQQRGEHLRQHAAVDRLRAQRDPIRPGAAMLGMPKASLSNWVRVDSRGELEMVADGRPVPVVMPGTSPRYAPTCGSWTAISSTRQRTCRRHRR